MDQESEPQQSGAMNSLWDLVQAYRDETGASEAWIMRRAGLNKGTFTAWRQRGIPRLPEHVQLIALADALKIPYEVLLNAVLHDTSYLPEAVAREQAEHGAEYLDALWRRVRDLAMTAFREAGGNRKAAGRALYRQRSSDGTTDSALVIAANLLTTGTLPATAPDWLSGVFDSHDLPAAAKAGELEGTGENDI
jgi:hypothetical protein